MTTVTIPVSITRRRLDHMHAERARCGLLKLDDATLLAIVIEAGFEAEHEDLLRLRDGAATPKPMGSLGPNVERDLAGVILD